MFIIHKDKRVKYTKELVICLQDVHEMMRSASQWDADIILPFTNIDNSICDHQCAYSVRRVTYAKMLLIEKGVPEEPLCTVLCLDKTNKPHCVLMVLSSGSEYILSDRHTSLITLPIMRWEGYRLTRRETIDNRLIESWDRLR